MNIQSLHSNFIAPTRSTEQAGAFDLYMPEPGFIPEMSLEPVKVGLGFAAEVPAGFGAFVIPRSSTGSKHGVELQNTVGFIDADYRGEWFAFLNTKTGEHFKWDAGSRVLQVVIVPVYQDTITLVDSVSKTKRGTSGFGSTGK